MAKMPLAYDPEKLRQAFSELKGQPRTPRVLDVLIAERDGVTEMLRDGRQAKEIWSAFKKAGLDVSYSAFQRALKIFEQRAGVPGGRRLSRFLPTAAPKSSAAAVTAMPGPGAPAASAAQRRAALAAPSAAELEQQRLSARTA